MKVVTLPMVEVDKDRLKEIVKKSKESNTVSLVIADSKMFVIMNGTIKSVQLREVKKWTKE